MNEEAQPRSGLRDHWPVIVLVLVAMTLALVARHEIYPAYSWNRDEPVYLWQTQVLRDGQVTSTDGGSPNFFHPWLSAATDGKIFSQYTLGWPLVLLGADTLFGTPDAALALGAGLAVLGVYALTRELTRDRRLAIVAAAVMSASPIVPVQGGAYLGYLFTLGLGLLFAAGLLNGVRRHRGWLIAGSGVLLGWIFLTRPYDAVLWGLAAAGYALYDHWREWPRLIRSALWLAAGALPLVVVTLAYNWHVTGSIASFPITVADPLDRFGFGKRRIMPAFPAADFTPFQAVKSTLKQGGYLPLFLFGSYAGLLTAAYGLWLRRRERSTIGLLALIAVFPLGYFIFWGVFVSASTANLSGPIYYIPLYAPLSVLIAAALLEVWQRRRSYGIALAVGLVVVTIPFEVSRLQINRDMSRQQIAYEHADDAVRGRALVFVPGSYLLFLNPYARNTTQLDGRILYAIDRGAANLDLMSSYPDRTAYLQQNSLAPAKLLPGGNPLPLRVTTSRIRVDRAPAMTVKVRATARRGRKVVVAYLHAGGRTLRRTLSRSARPGQVFETSWRVAVPSAANRGDVALRSRLGHVSVGVGYGRSPRDATSTAHLRFSERFPYRLKDGRIEALHPTQRYARVKINQHYEWEEIARTPGFSASITPAG